MADSSFIGPGEQEQFGRPGRCLPRTLRSLPSPHASDAGGREVDLARFLRERLESLGRLDSRWFDASCIRVRRDDGMSWSAEAARLTLGALRPQFRLLALSPRLALANLPPVAELVGQERYFRLASRHLGGLAHAERRPWLKALIVLGSVVLAGGIAGVRLHLENRLGSVAAPLGSPLFYVGSVLLTLLGMLGERLLLGGRSEAGEERAPALAQALANSSGKAARDDLVSALVERLSLGPFPRFVVIDDFEALDELTREVLLTYFRSHAERAAGSEAWVVFESEDGDRLSARLVDQGSGFATQRLHVLEQQFLNTAEKERLAELIGKPEQSAFTTVKSVSRGVQPDETWLGELFKQHRTRRPADPAAAGPLELLYLLAFNSLGGNVPLAFAFVESTLARKAGLRPELLRLLLPGTRLNKAELRARLREVVADFGSVCVVEGEAEKRAIRVRREVAVYLEAHHAELGLPAPAIGDLFWVSLWLDRLRGRPVEAFWVRKLGQHLLRLTPTALPPPLAQALPAIEEELFEALLFAADGALRTCIFDLVDDLLEAAHLLAERREESGWLERLLPRCWDSYCLLGSERSLALVLQIRELTTETAEEAPAEALDPGLDLFFQMLELAPGLRARLSPALVRGMLGGGARLEALADYAAVRAAWLALLGARLAKDVSGVAMPRLEAAARQAVGRVLPSASAALERARLQQADARRLVNLETVSLGLWCGALALDIELRVWLETRAGAALAVDGAPAPALLGTLSALPEDWKRLSALARGVIELAAELHGDGTAAGGEARSDTDFVAHALARELCAVALAAVLTARHTLRVEALDAVAGADIEALLHEVERLFGHRLTSEDGAVDLEERGLYERVDDLLELSGVVFAHFGLERLRDLVSLRHIQFQVACGGLRADDSGRFVSLLASLAPALADRGAAGILGNLVVADARMAAQDVAAQYVHQAAHSALAAELGADVQDELCLLAVLLQPDGAQPLLARLLTRDESGEPRLARLARATPADQAEGLAMRLLNLGAFVEREPMSLVVGIIRRMADEAGDAPGGDALRALLDMFAVEQALDRGQHVKTDRVLAEWRHGRDAWTWANLLHLLLVSGHDDPRALGEAEAALRREPAHDAVNAWFKLALWFCARRAASAGMPRAGAPTDPAPATRYLLGAIERWKRRSSAETNVQAYQALATLDPPRRLEHMAEVQRWLAVKIERDHLKQLPALARQGRFFLVFEDYFSSLRFWGLAADAPDDQLFEELHKPPAERAALVAAWQASGAPVPQPLVLVEGRRAVSARFLVLGHCLFSPPLAQRDDHAELRRAFDMAAQHQLRPLVQMILSSPSLPPSIRELLSSYAQRFIDYWVPAD